MIVKTGFEILKEKGYKPLHGQRVGLLTNPSAIDRTLESTYYTLCHEKHVNMVALFAPEHGAAGTKPEGENITSGIDTLTGLPLYSLYGESYSPTPEMLKDLDVIVCDIQDVGARYYTYVWTISHILEAAGKYNTTVVLLDRPNPLGGIQINGPLLNPQYSSLVGRYPVPIQHGMTLGELVWMINETWNTTLARLSIISCKNWERDMTWKDTRLPWAPPSPNMPHLSTVRHYPGACLIEGTNLSEGRGTSLPFEVTGAPWIDDLKLAHHLNAQPWCDDYGVRFRPHTFIPNQSKWAGEVCYGVQVYIHNETTWRPIEAWLSLISEIRHLYPDDFEWLPAVSASGMRHFDRLVGSPHIRENIDNNLPIREMAETWRADCAAFDEARQPFLLYE